MTWLDLCLKKKERREGAKKERRKEGDETPAATAWRLELERVTLIRIQL